ncbi:High-affnity carbon uptake protein Hat/HatR [Fimbriiglobus ruber]|uniref:High-affnity carbon uptake protein Hat/HatR n=1 Tax=Fimbriiglobus ruber TaxID=1908690 RepID=A0A225DBE8_9BACT|nr:High-affnity carbon uptake protein Hat/HatR [Fimbriiglobus ruber]
MAAGETQVAEDVFARHPEIAAHPEYRLDVVAIEFFTRLDRAAPDLLAECEFRFPGSGEALRQQLTLESLAGHGRAPLLTVTPVIPGFRSFEVIGRGRTGVVYRAFDEARERPVAVKVLNPEWTLTESQLRRFRIEAEAAARVDHPNVVTLYGFGEVNGFQYLVMEYVSGETLADRTSPVSLRQAVAWARDLARAVQALHDRHVAHRDLKPANVLVDANGRLKVTDFGLAKLLDQPGSSSGQLAVGTLPYMAPEQLDLAANPIGTAIDIRACGLILLELATGKRAFANGTPAEIIRRIRAGWPDVPVTDLPADLRVVIGRCLELDPRDRYRSAADLADDLDRFLAGRPVSARRVGPAGRTRRWVRQHPIPAALLALAFGSLITGAGVAGWQWHRAEARAADLSVARQRAESDFESAFATVTKLSELISHRALDTPDSQADREAHAARVLAYYEQFVADRGDDPKVREQLYLAHMIVGQLATLRGRTDEAVAAYEAARRSGEGRWNLDDPADAVESCRLLRTLAFAYRAAGRTADRDGVSDECDRRCAALVEAPDTPRDLIVQALELMGRFEESRDRQRTVAVIRKALERAAGPPELPSRLELIRCAFLLNLAEEVRSVAGAEAAVGALTGLLVRVRRAPPEQGYAADVHYHLLHGYLVWGRLLEGEVKPARAREVFQAGVASARESRPLIANRHSSTMEAEMGLRLGQTYRELGQAENSVAALRAAADLWRALDTAFPGNVWNLRHVGVCLHDIGNVYRDSRRPTDALATYREALEVRTNLWQKYPADIQLRLDVSVTANEVGKAIEYGGDPTDAIRYYRTALDHQKAVVAAWPEDARAKRWLTDRYRTLARAYRAAGRANDAREVEQERDHGGK